MAALTSALNTTLPRPSLLLDHDWQACGVAGNDIGVFRGKPQRDTARVRIFPTGNGLNRLDRLGPAQFGEQGWNVGLDQRLGRNHAGQFGQPFGSPPLLLWFVRDVAREIQAAALLNEVAESPVGLVVGAEGRGIDQRLRLRGEFVEVPIIDHAKIDVPEFDQLAQFGEQVRIDIAAVQRRAVNVIVFVPIELRQYEHQLRLHVLGTKRAKEPACVAPCIEAVLWDVVARINHAPRKCGVIVVPPFPVQRPRVA